MLPIFWLLRHRQRCEVTVPFDKACGGGGGGGSGGGGDDDFLLCCLSSGCCGIHSAVR